MIREALTLQALSALAPRDAAAWFIARRAEGLTSSEQQLLADWLAQDETHRRMFDNADQAWKSFDDSKDDEILLAMRAHAKAPRRRAALPWRSVAAAAAVVVAVSASVLFVPGLNPWPPAVETLQYASARGEVREVGLPDGGSMTLDADSVAVGRFSDRRRGVELQRGRAYFDVAPDTSRPFAVTAAGRSITAVGTVFDVNLTAGMLTVTLLEGRVEIGFPNSTQAPVMLEPGQQYVEQGGRGAVRTVGASGSNSVSWRSGLVSFDDQTLSEAAAVMNRYSQTQIVINDPGVASLRISGQFRAGDFQRFADTLAEMHRLRPVRTGNQLELLPQN